jgi:hypothetical protein
VTVRDVSVAKDHDAHENKNRHSDDAKNPRWQEERVQSFFGKNVE